LNDAISAGDAGRVIGFFRGFERQAGGAGQAGPMRTGGRTYTRPLIAQLYEKHRRGGCAGREADWAQQEADIIAAAREGRVLGAIPDQVIRGMGLVGRESTIQAAPPVPCPRVGPLLFAPAARPARGSANICVRTFFLEMIKMDNDVWGVSGRH
jgi:hypothetical protein